MESLFSFIFQAPPILCVSKFAPQEHEDESQKYSRSIEGTAIGFSTLSAFSSHHSSSCYPSELIFAGASKFPLFNLREVTLSFSK